MLAVALQLLYCGDLCCCVEQITADVTDIVQKRLGILQGVRSPGRTREEAALTRSEAASSTRAPRALLSGAGAGTAGRKAAGRADAGADDGKGAGRAGAGSGKGAQAGQDEGSDSGSDGNHSPLSDDDESDEGELVADSDSDLGGGSEDEGGLDDADDDHGEEKGDKQFGSW